MTIEGEPEYTTQVVKSLEFEIQGKTYVGDFIV